MLYLEFCSHSIDRQELPQISASTTPKFRDAYIQESKDVDSFLSQKPSPTNINWLNRAELTYRSIIIYVGQDEAKIYNEWVLFAPISACERS